MQSTHRLAALLAVAGMLALPGIANAQQYPPPPPPPGSAQPPPPPPPQPGSAYPGQQAGYSMRYGLYGGLGLGFGTITCDNCEGLESVAFTGDLGFRLNPRLGIFIDAFSLTHFETDFSVSHLIFTGGLQYWLSPLLWVKAGLGGARWQVENDDFVFESDEAAAMMVAGGFEALHSPGFTLDLEVRFGAGFYDVAPTTYNVGIGLAVHWHSLFYGQRRY